MFGKNTWKVIFLVVVMLMPTTALGSQNENMKLTLALSSPHVWIQPVIAQSEGYFKEVGLEVKIVRFTSGRAAMDALIGGQADLATTAISPVILASFQNQPMSILAENARFLEEKITARVESGITKPADLAGKKIGVKLGTDIHYFLHLFLKHAGLSIEDVQLVNLRPPDMVISLVRGDVDAFASWKPHPDKAKAAMGDKAIFLTQPDPPIFESLYLTVGMQALVKENPEAYKRFMKAMVKADEYAASNRKGAVASVAKISEVDVETAASLMKGYSYKIWLDQSLIEGSDKRAVFQMENDMAPAGVAKPDFMKFIDKGPLQSVAPDRVSLD